MKIKTKLFNSYVNNEKYNLHCLSSTMFYLRCPDTVVYYNKQEIEKNCINCWKFWVLPYNCRGITRLAGELQELPENYKNCQAIVEKLTNNCRGIERYFIEKSHWSNCF